MEESGSFFVAYLVPVGVYAFFNKQLFVFAFGTKFDIVLGHQGGDTEKQIFAFTYRGSCILRNVPHHVFTRATD